jgi:hypothetical protein
VSTKSVVVLSSATQLNARAAHYEPLAIRHSKKSFGFSSQNQWLMRPRPGRPTRYAITAYPPPERLNGDAERRSMDTKQIMLVLEQERAKAGKTLQE